MATPPSLSARERENPPPRRKSCSACIKAKRRCDAGSPACIRCAQRKIPCDYPRPSARAARRPVGVGVFPLVEMESLLHFDIPACVDAPVCVDAPLDFGTTHLDEILEASPSLSYDGFSLLGTQEPPLPLQTRSEEPGMLVPPATRELDFSSEVFHQRLKYAMGLIRKAPVTMVQETKTPWCHALLWEEGMPRSMQDAHACCALYMAKTRVNAPVILRSIEARIRDLLSMPGPSTDLDCLAHTQALLLYQTIRLFDGDIVARSAAERMIPALEESALALVQHVTVDNMPLAPRELSLFPIGPTRELWRNWIFQESARRTLFVAFYFIQAYRFLAGYKNLSCDGRLGLVHSWTLSSYLWNARSPVEFAHAWRDKKHHVLVNTQIGELLREAHPDDVDEFGKLILSSALGSDELEGWMASSQGTRSRATD